MLLTTIVMGLSAVVSVKSLADHETAAKWGTLENPVYGGEIVLQEVESVVKSEMPRVDVLPANFDWRTSGFLSTDLNQVS